MTSMTTFTRFPSKFVRKVLILKLVINDLVIAADFLVYNGKLRLHHKQFIPNCKPNRRKHYSTGELTPVMILYTMLSL